MTSTRGDRRRRMLSEERISTQSAATADATRLPNGEGPACASPQVQRYTQAASYHHQPRLTDVIPRRLTTIAIFLLVAVSAVSGLMALAIHEPKLAAALGRDHLPPIDLAFAAVPSSLSVWFSSVILVLASLISILVYSVRRHRIDDYHGRYRIWIWAGLGWLGLSLNTTTGLHRFFTDLMIETTGWSIGKDGAIWWLAPAIIVFASFGVRLIADILESRLAFVSLLAALACWAAAIITYLELLSFVPADVTAVVISATTLSGQVLLLGGLVIYARYVIIQADVNVSVAARRVRKDRVARKKKPANLPQATVPPDGRKKANSPTADRKRPTTASSVSRRTDLENDDEPPSNVDEENALKWTDGRDGFKDAYNDEVGSTQKRRKLSKSERKQLRKQKELERRAA